MSDHLKPIVEALIFASPEPLTPKTLYRLLEGELREDVDAALAAVKTDYESARGLQVAEVAGGYQIVTRPELVSYSSALREMSTDFFGSPVEMSGRTPA